MTATLTTIHGPTVWRGADLDPAAWQIDCDAATLTALGALGERLERRQATVETVDPADFDVPELHALASRITATLRDGPGIAMVRTWPVARWGVDTTGMLFWGLGTLLGRPLPQNNNGRRLSSVSRQIAGEARLAESARRGSRSDEEIDFHTENALPPHPPRIISLLCCRPAQQGGESEFVSGHTVYNDIRRQDPEAAALLTTPVAFGRQDGTWADGLDADIEPVFSPGDGPPRVRFNRYWIDRGQGAAGQPENPRLTEALDLFEAVAHRPGTPLTHTLQPGEMVFVNNTVVLHSRRKFTDPVDPAQGRMLWRLWCA
jgi:TfdA family taurine catabolism dioxygenase TauD